MLAGLGFGVLFAAWARSRTGPGSGRWSLNQLVGGRDGRGGRDRARRRGGCPHAPGSGGAWPALLGGVGDGAFLLATHHGLLSVSAVLTSLYPAFTVLLAALVLRERIHRVQAWGLALCGVAVVLVAGRSADVRPVAPTAPVRPFRYLRPTLPLPCLGG